MQPALQLVSQVLYQRPEYLNAALKVWDHKVLDDHLDPRTIKSFVLRKFDTKPVDDQDPNLYAEMAFLREPFYSGAVDTLWNYLENHLSWSIQGDPGCWALSTSQRWPEPNDEHGNFNILLNADMVMPLLAPGYSSSEKTMASFAIASTMLHELAVSRFPLRFGPRKACCNDFSASVSYASGSLVSEAYFCF